MHPEPTEYAAYYQTYVGLVPEDDILQVLGGQTSELASYAASVSPAREGHRYAAGKWSIRQVFGHLTDAERVFQYRLLWVARCAKEPLPGFDENDFVVQANFNDMLLKEHVETFSAARGATLSLARSLPQEAWTRTGIANKNPISARALAWIMAGHVRHHLTILKDRYA